MAVAVKTEGLTKTFKRFMYREPVSAVSDLDLEVQEGEIFGFLGPNGAGKTTTIKMLLGLTYPTAGKAWLLEKPAGDIQVKTLISYLPESPYFYEHMSGTELLSFYARLFHMGDCRPKVEQLLRMVGLYADRHKPLSQYSKGMLQRIGIAQALVNDPKLLFFDEPTSGLDPIAHAEIRDLILRLRDEGRTVFLSSHQLSDVEMVCDRVAILNRGKLLRLGRLDEMLAGGCMEIKAENVEPKAVDKIKAAGAGVRMEDGRVVITQDEGKGVDQVIDAIRAGRGHILSVIPQRRSLEDLFVETIREGCE